MSKAPKRHNGIPGVCLAALMLAGGVADAATGDAMAEEILAELVSINTAPSGGPDLRPAIDALVDRLRAAGFGEDDISVLAQTETLPNLVVKLRSPEPTLRPILMMAHLDVVEARREDWSIEPYALTEQDGYFYGRGTTDNKAGAAMLVANLIRLKQEGFEPNRDLVVMLTADEETTGAGADWLVTEHRDLVDAEFALNTDGGLVMLRNDEPQAFIMQTSEKMYASFVFEALDPGGHSSLPRANSAISRVARTLVALEDHDFPIDLNETTQAYFERWAELAPPNDRDVIDAVLEASPEAELGNYPYYNALSRTTCVATMLDGGHAENALPQDARATVNCRILPQTPVAEIISVLESLGEPHGVTVRQLSEPRPSPPSPLRDDVVEPVADIAGEYWPGIRLIPEMSTGATDGLFVRNAGIPVYGISAIAEDPDDIRAHGQDERIRIEAFHQATSYWYRVVKRLAVQ